MLKLKLFIDIEVDLKRQQRYKRKSVGWSKVPEETRMSVMDSLDLARNRTEFIFSTGDTEVRSN